MKPKEKVSFATKVASTLFLAATGLFLILMNKIVLTSYKFPSFNFLGMSQAIVIVTSLRLAKMVKLVDFPDLTRGVPQKIFPIPIFYLLNLLTSLGATQHLTIPMFTVLRRLGIVMTLGLEYMILDIKPSRLVILAVAQIILGSGIAAYEDLSFDMLGYVLILIYDFFGASEGVFVKKKLDEAASLGQVGVLYYSVLFSVVPICIFVWLNGDMELAFAYEQWSDHAFVFWFFGTNFMGLFNLYSWVMCTDYNSPLMSQIVSCLRSVLVTYVGMFVGGDYVFNLVNFIGLNISMFGGFAYSYATFKGTTSAPESKDKDNQSEKEKFLQESPETV